MINSYEFYNQLRDRIRLSDVVRQRLSLAKKGKEYLGLCPFHHEKTPSFTVNDIKRFYHCFGCGAHGDVIKFVSEINSLSYRDAAIKLARDNGIEPPKMSSAQKKEYEYSEQLYKVMDLAADFYLSCVTKEVRDYLATRGIDEQTRKRAAIGYAPSKSGELLKFFEQKGVPPKLLVDCGLLGKKEDGRLYELLIGRVVFPIRNVYNKIVGFGGRVIGSGLPKYINSPETPIFKKSEVMYGENIAATSAYQKKYSIVVEGYMDVIALNKAGVREVVASLGTAVNEKHLQKLWRFGDEVIVCLDGDSAGERASNRLLEIALPLIGVNKRISFVKLPAGKDPDDIINQHGVDYFYKLIAGRLELSEFIWRLEYSGKNFASPENRAQLEANLNEYCTKIDDRMIASNYRRYFKEQLWQNVFSYKKPASYSLKDLRNQVAQGSVDIDLASLNNYSESEILEKAICVFLVKYPQILKNEILLNHLEDMALASEELSDFKEWLLNQAQEKGELDAEMIGEIVKTTRFYSIFLLLSDPEKNFLDSGFLVKNQDRAEQIFDLLLKKCYLLALKNEYSLIMRSNVEDKESKMKSFLHEIAIVNDEIRKLNEIFTD